MIIKKNINLKDSSSSKNIKMPKSNLIKKEDFETVDEKKEEKQKSEPKKQDDEDFEKIDISKIEFKERIERRRGDRRRGYRRIDERSLVSRAQQEAHSIKELAAREGYQNGLSRAQGELEEIKKSIVEFLNMKDEVYEDIYPHIMEIAIATAQKIIKKEVEVSKDILKEIIIGAMEELNSETQKVEIKVNSNDVEFARVSLPEIIDETKSEVKVIVTPDDSVDEGSCIIVANNGVIDANFKTQLAVLQNAFGIYKGGL